MWPSDRVLSTGLCRLPRAWPFLDRRCCCARPGRVGAATPRLYDPIVLAPLFLCRSALASSCPRGPTALNVWYCPSAASALCYNSTGHPPPTFRSGGGGGGGGGSVWQWSGDRLVEWSDAGYGPDALSLLTSGALLLVLLTLIRPPLWPTGRLALWLHPRASPPPAAAPLGPALPSRRCRLRCSFAGAGPAAALRRRCGWRWRAPLCGVPPRARAALGAVRPLLHVAGDHDRAHRAPVRLLLTAGLTTLALFPLLAYVDACVLALSLYCGGWISRVPPSGRLVTPHKVDEFNTTNCFRMPPAPPAARVRCNRESPVRMPAVVRGGRAVSGALDAGPTKFRGGRAPAADDRRHAPATRDCNGRARRGHVHPTMAQMPVRSRVGVIYTQSDGRRAAKRTMPKAPPPPVAANI